ncbi:sodium-dependent glucose transporter 1 isoform 2-T2 [Spinachia spinachia]
MTSSSSVVRDTVKKKHVRFASMEDNDDNDQDEDTLFDKGKDSGSKLKSALKAAEKRTKPGSDGRVEVVGGGRGGHEGGGRVEGVGGQGAGWMVTLVLCASFLGLGMSISVVGPTFEDLAVNVKQNISNISYIFVGRSAGYLGGSLFGGLLFDCMNAHLLLGFSMLMTSVGMCVIPFCKQALLLTGLMSSIGISMGILDTGAEVAYGSFIFTFAKDYAGMNPSEAAGLNSLFWAAFAMCRGLAIFFAACMYPGTMILLSVVGSTLSSLLLCLFSKERVALWVCTGLYGASMATTFPSGISWVEQYTTVTGRTAAAFVVGAALGEMVLPALVGFLLGKFHDQPLLMYLSLITATFTSILFPVMYKLASDPSSLSRKPRARCRPDSDDSETRQSLLDSVADEEDDNEADEWNDADFEVIEMDDAACLINSPSKASSPHNTGPTERCADSNTQETELAGATLLDAMPLVGDSPKRKLLLSLDREKRD